MNVQNTTIMQQLIVRDGVIRLKITLATLVVIASALVQTIVDSRPIHKKHDCPYNKQQQRGAKERPYNENQLALPGWGFLFFVFFEHWLW